MKRRDRLDLLLAALDVCGLLVAFILLVAIIVIGLWQWNSIKNGNHRIEIGDESMLVSSSHRKDVVIDAPPGSTYVPYVPAKLEPIPGAQYAQIPNDPQTPR